VVVVGVAPLQCDVWLWGVASPSRVGVGSRHSSRETRGLRHAFLQRLRKLWIRLQV